MPHEPEYDLTLQQAIEQAARDPQSFSVDGMTAESRSIKEMIEAAEYLAEQEVVSSEVQPHFGIRFTQLIPPGGGG